MQNGLLDYLLSGDPSIAYQTRKYLLGDKEKDLSQLRKRIALEGYGKMFLEEQNEDLSFGEGFYAPKWVSTNYTLLDLRYLEIERETQSLAASVKDIAVNLTDRDGGIRLSPHGKSSDICVDGMFLNYATYFALEESLLKSLVDSLIKEQLPDGGFNCQSKTRIVHHSSMHTTLSVLEGIHEYLKHGYLYRKVELERMEKEGREFLLLHNLFRSDKTGEIISPGFLSISYPPRWKYDILKALYYFTDAEVPYDERMDEALGILDKKRNPDGSFPKGKTLTGNVHFIMEKGRGSRWNTLRATRVLQYYERLHGILREDM